jgi:hypothetical protein
MQYSVIWSISDFFCLIWGYTAGAAGADASDKSLEIMRKFSEQYARRSNTFFCSEKSVTAVVIKVMEPNLFSTSLLNPR